MRASQPVADCKACRSSVPPKIRKELVVLVVVVAAIVPVALVDAVVVVTATVTAAFVGGLVSTLVLVDDGVSGSPGGWEWLSNFWMNSGGLLAHPSIRCWSFSA